MVWVRLQHLCMQRALNVSVRLSNGRRLEADF